jgi:hypothetical protein
LYLPVGYDKAKKEKNAITIWATQQYKDKTQRDK